jgi:hypothetical protein
MAVALNLQRAQLAVKAEGTEGSAETLTADEAKIRCRNIKVTYDFGVERDESVAASLSPDTGTCVGPFVGAISFEIVIAGSGTNGTAPAWYTLMQAAGWGVTGDVLAPVDDQGSSLTMGWYCDGTRHLLHGARASSWTFTHPSGKQTVLAMNFSGVYSAMTDTALLTNPTYETTVPPAFLSGSITLHSIPIKVGTITFAGENTVEPILDPNQAAGVSSFALVGKRHWHGSVDISKTSAATKDWYASWTGNTLSSLAYTIGGTTGNTFAFAMPKAQIAKVNPGERGNIATHDIEVDFVKSASAGSDEATITQN